MLRTSWNEPQFPALPDFRAERTRREAARQRNDVQLNAEAIRERCSTLIGFMREAWHVLEPKARFVSNWHLEVLCAHLEAVTDGRINRLLVNIWPGSSKSMAVSVIWQAWEWGPRGLRSNRFLATAYNDGPVKRDTRKCRDLILSEWYQSLWPEVQLTRTAEMSFANSSTGTREGIAFGSLTSQRGDRLICLPFEAKILTELGWLRIGEVVDGRIPVRIAGWNGEGVEWQAIDGYEKNPPGEIVEVTFDHGSIRCTADHPIFVVGFGWVRADQVKDGQTALYCEGIDGLPLLRKTGRARSAWPEEVLQPVLLRSREEASRSGGPNLSVLDVRDSNLSNSGKDTRKSILLAEMQGNGELRPEQSNFLRWASFYELRTLRRRVLAKARRGDETGSKNLFDILRREVAIRPKWKGRLGALLRVLRDDFQSGKSKVSILLDVVRKYGSSEANARRWQWSLRQRSECAALSCGMVPLLQGDNPLARWEPLSSLRGNRSDRNAGAPRPSYRLRKDEPRYGESDHGLQVLPRNDARKTNTAPRVVETTIRSVKSLGFDGEPTFNVKANPCRNYFAEGLLVHNCDDPHSTETAESAVEREKTTRKFREGALNRLNDQERSAIVVIMQRLHEDDISGVIRKLGMDFVYLCLPMEYEIERRCETILGVADPRTRDGDLADPIRFPRDVVEGLKRDMGAYAYAGQYQQRPAPREGALFKRQWFADKIISAAAIPPGTRWVRHWDLAATARKTAARTAGVKLGRTPAGGYIVAHVVTTQSEGNAVRELIKAQAAIDGIGVNISLPQDPGQAGKVQAQDLVAMLAGYIAHAEPETGDKVTRAAPFAAQCEAGNVQVVAGPWNDAYFDELVTFPGGSFADQVDASSGAFARLAAPGNTGIIEYYRREVEALERAAGASTSANQETVAMIVPPGVSTAYGMAGQKYTADVNGMILVRAADVGPLKQAGFSLMEHENVS